MEKMKKKEIITLWNVLNAIKDKDEKGDIIKMSPKFRYGLTKNKDRLEKEIKLLEDVNRPEPEYLKFENERVKVCITFADKNEEGKPLQNGNNYVIKEKKKEFEEAIAKLKEEHKEAVDKEDERRKKFNEILNEEVEMHFHKILVDEVPETLSQDEMDFLSDLIIFNEI